MTARFSARPWWFPAGAGGIAIVGFVSGSHLWQSIGFVYVALVTVPVVIEARRTNGLPERIAVGLCVLAICNALADLMRTLSDGHPQAMVWSETIGVLGVVMLIAGIAFVAYNRRGQDFWSILADGSIVALGIWLVAWVTIVRPTIEEATVSSSLTVLRSAFPPLGAVVVFLLIIIVFSDTSRTPATIYSSVAIVFGLLGGFMRLLRVSGHLEVNLSTPLSTFAVGLLFSAILHPSVGRLVVRTPAAPDGAGACRQFVGRIIVIATMIVGSIITMSAIEPIDGVDRVVRTISVGVLATVVAARTMQSMRATREAQAVLLYTARADPLTGLPNRTLLLEHIEAAMHNMAKGDSAGVPTLFFIDLDRFKNINDSLGHAAGDRVLCTLAERLLESVPADATVARIAGDEFVVLQPSSPGVNDALDLADVLLARLSELIRLPAPLGDLFVTTSIGVARRERGSTTSAHVLLGHADTAMYQAKDAGRNCVALFDESMQSRVAHRMAIETALFRALDRGELCLHYQPILEMATGEVTGFEALMRWQQSDGTMVSPAEFIPIAEETGTIIKIGAWALLEAMTQLHRWIEDGVCSPTANMSVNVSPRQLADPTFPMIVGDVLLCSQLPPDLLWIEVTEGIMISEPELALATLRRLRLLGVGVAIDDFGTGYSSLSSLQRFPLQRLKIDRAFVQGVADNAGDRALVRTIIAMGTSLDLDMVAEGVETEDQLQILDELGCKKFQGYLISRPVPPDAMRETVARIERSADADADADVAQRSSTSELASSNGNRSSV